MDRKVLGWILVATGLALSWRLSAEYLWILSLLPIAAWLTTGVVFLVMYLLNARRAELRRRALVQAGWLLGGLTLFLPLGTLSGRLTEIVRFRLQRPDYDRVVAMVTADVGAPGFRKTDGLEYIVDEGPPTRVAFVWPGGIIDNWCGVVYDPTGVVLSARPERYSDAWRASPITKLFGGDLLECRRADGPYYHCCFT